MILTTINRTPKAYLIAILGAEHVTGIVPVGALLETRGGGRKGSGGGVCLYACVCKTNKCIHQS